MRVFVDSNVFFDYVLKRAPFFVDANALMLILNERVITAGTNPNNFPHVFYLLRKQYGTVAAKHKLALLRAILECEPLTAEVIDMGLSKSGSVDLEDGITAILAQRYAADVLVTRDPKGFPDQPIRVLSPKQFVDEHYAKFPY